MRRHRYCRRPPKGHHHGAHLDGAITTIRYRTIVTGWCKRMNYRVRADSFTLNCGVFPLLEGNRQEDRFFTSANWGRTPYPLPSNAISINGEEITTLPPRESFTAPVLNVLHPQTCAILSLRLRYNYCFARMHPGWVAVPLRASTPDNPSFGTQQIPIPTGQHRFLRFSDKLIKTKGSGLHYF